MIKAVFFDVDGTLLSFKTHEVPESTRKSLEALREKGIKIFVATGRSPMSFQKVLDRIGFDFDGFIYNNGQYVVVEGKVIRDQALDKEDLISLLEYIEEKEIATSFTELEYSYMNFTNDRVKKLENLLGFTAPNRVFDSPERVRDNMVYQIAPYIIEGEEEDFFKCTKNLRGVRWNPFFLDVIPKDGGKACGIASILEYFGIHKDEVMAFGDGGNDTEMLAYVKHGVAMGNAVEEAKEACEYVTAHVDEDGIYKALIRYGVIEEL